MRDMAAFFFWTSWSAATSRPGQAISYTNNWPHEPLVGNRPTGGCTNATLTFVALALRSAEKIATSLQSGR